MLPAVGVKTRGNRLPDNSRDMGIAIGLSLGCYLVQSLLPFGYFMKTLCSLTVFIVLTALCVIPGRAATISATGSGNWDSTTPNAPWPGGAVPAATDNVIIGAGFTVTVASPASVNNLTVNGTGVCQNNSSLTASGNISGSGTLAQGASATLTVAGATSGLTILDATASGNTVNYTGNAGGGV